MVNLSDNMGINRIEPSNGGVVAPDKVKMSVGAARAVYYTLRTNHLPRIVLYAEIAGMIAGNAPFDPVKLREAGLNIANFNTLEPRAWFERGALSYYNLLYTNESIINITLRGSAPELKEIGQILSRNWNDVVREEWRSFDTNMASLCSQLVMIGVSPALWKDESSFKWQVAEMNNYLVPDQCQSDLDLMTQMCVENQMSAAYLIGVYNEYKNKPGETKWNIAELEMLLAFIANNPTKNTYDPQDALMLQNKITQGDIRYDTIYNETVPLVSHFYQENDGTITHRIFHKYYGMADSEQFLYEFKSQYKSFSHFSILFTMSPGERYIHSNRGIGHKIFALSQAKMINDNSLSDLARWASTPIIKTSATAIMSADGIRINQGAPTNIGASDFVNNTLGANIEPVIMSSQYFSSMLSQNAAMSGDDPGVPDRSHGSLAPTSEKFKALREYGILRNQVSHFYSTCDVLFREMVVRMLNLDRSSPDYKIAQKWKQRCIDEGVPEEIFKTEKGELPKFWQVRATRVAGAGSQLGHLVSLETLIPILGSLGMGRREALAVKKDAIIATVGPEYIASYTQDDNDVDEVAGGASLANVENVIMEGGKAALATGSNDHRAHIEVHLALGRQIMEKAGQMPKEYVIEADRIFNVLIPHLQEHIQFLAPNIFAKGFLEQVKGPYEQIAKYAGLVRGNAIRYMEAQARQQQQDEVKTQQVMGDEERKNFQAMKDEQRKDFKIAQTVERAKEANATRAEVIKTKTVNDIENKRMLAEAEVSSKQIKAMS